MIENKLMENQYNKDDNINNIRTAIVDTLDEFGKIDLEVSTENNDEWKEKMEFLNILTYNEVVSCEYDKTVNVFNYTTNTYKDQNGVQMKPSEVIQMIDEHDRIQNENNLQCSGEMNIAEDEFQDLTDAIMMQLQTERAYSISAVYEEDNILWVDEMLILSELHNQGYVYVDFCVEHLNFTYHLHDELNLMKGSEDDMLEYKLKSKDTETIH